MTVEKHSSASAPQAQSHEPITFPLLETRCSGPEGDDDCVPGQFERTFSEHLPWLLEHRQALEEQWLAALKTAHYPAYGLAWLRSERALPTLRARLLADRYFYGWETSRPDDPDVLLADEQYTHHLAYAAAIEHISGKELAEAVALTQEERDRLFAEAQRRTPQEHGWAARWLLQRLLLPDQEITVEDPLSAPLFFYDGCWESASPTKDEATSACARLHRTGDAWTRRGCRCRPDDLIEVREDDPIAFYHYGTFDGEQAHCPGTGDTPLAAWRNCAYQQLSTPPLGVGSCKCPANGPTPVRGPYTRRRDLGGFDDPETVNYLNPTTGMWINRDGEGPCFVAGTKVATPKGPRSIEELRPNDQVIARDPDSATEVIAEVISLRTRQAETLLRLTLASGEVLTTTPNHPFYAPTTDTWLDAGGLRAGDAILHREDSDGHAEPMMISAIAEISERTEVFSISVTSPHTYFAGNALVHNY